MYPGAPLRAAGAAVALPLVKLIGDVKDLDGLRAIFAKQQPQVVFHAAAYKHVPLMEEHNAAEALRGYEIHIPRSDFPRTPDGEYEARVVALIRGSAIVRTSAPIMHGDSGSGAWVGEDILGLLVARLSSDHSLGRVEYAPSARLDR